MGIITKIYPNGEASLYFERMLKKKNFKPTPKQRDRSYLHYCDAKREYGREFAWEMQNQAKRGGASLGLVTVPISTKNGESRSQCKGLTRVGARTLRQGAFLLEKWHGKDQITFGTATVPSVTDEELEYICTNWSEIVDRFIKRIKYQLGKKGIVPVVIHVTEIQMERFHNTGQAVPHLHFVFQGRKRKSSWAITPKQITKWWKAALRLTYSTTRTYAPTCQLARVRKSVSRYLSKYVSKKTNKTTQSTPSRTCSIWLIKQWWGITDSLRHHVKAATRSFKDARSERLWRAHEKENKIIWEYQGQIVGGTDSTPVIFTRFGRLTTWARQYFTRPELGSVGINT